MKSRRILAAGTAALLTLQGAAKLTAKPGPKEALPDIAGAYSMPIVQPAMPAPPPYLYKDSKIIRIAFTVPQEYLAKLIPPPLTPDPEKQVMVLYGGRFPMTSADLTYNETGLIVPVLRDGKPGGWFMVLLHLDRIEPILGGREIYGYPKLYAERIAFDEENGKITLSVTRYGKVIIKATFETQQKLDPIPPRPEIYPLYMLKLIPSGEKGASPDVMKLVLNTEVVSATKEVRLGKGTVEFGDSPYDPFLAKIPVGQVVYAEEAVEDFSLGYASTVTDYLHKSKNKKSGAAKP